MRNFQIEIPYTAMERLTNSNESFSDVLKAGVDGLAEFRDKLLETLPEIIRGVAGSNVGQIKKIEPFTADQKTFLKHLEKNNFASLRMLKATVPEGLRSTYSVYIEALMPAVEHMRTMQAKILLPYNIFLARLATNKKAALSTDTNAHLYSALAKERTEIYEAISKCFSGDDEPRSNYGGVIENNASWKNVFADMKKMTDTLNSIKVADINHLMRQSSDYLNIIHDEIEKKKIEDITPEAAKALSEGAYQIGCELEFFSIIYYRVLGLHNAIDMTVKEINEIIDKD